MEIWEEEPLIPKRQHDWYYGSDDDHGYKFSIKSRTFWSAQPERWSRPLGHPVNCVFVTYTLSDPCYSKLNCAKEAQYIQNYYMRNGTCPDIRYSFLIGGDGTIYEGRGWDKRPGLPPKYRYFNTHSIFIGFIGNFYDKPPRDTMFQGRDDLIMYGVQHNYIAEKFLLIHTSPAGKTYTPP